MRKILLFLAMTLVLVSCVGGRYGIHFQLGQSETEIVKELDGNLSEKTKYRYVKTSNEGNDHYSVLRVKGFSYEGMNFNTIRLGFENEELVYIQLKIYEKRNIERVIKYLSDEFGEGIDNKRHNNNNALCVKYWGDMDSDFICLEKCFDDYYQVYICSGENKYAKLIYKKLVIGSEY